jgi:hypothetical protein
MKIVDVPQAGKIGLQVAMPGRYGQVRRAWVVPANPRTAPQLEVRRILTGNAQRFRALSTAQQDAWNAAAASVQTRSRLGQSGPMTGAQFYTMINCNLQALGQELVDVPPARPTFADLAPTDLVITNTGNVIALKLTAPSDPGENTVLRATKPVSSATRAMPGVRVIGTRPAAVAGACDITALYTARYGVPTVGSRIFVEALLSENGWHSPARVMTALVPAGS